MTPSNVQRSAKILYVHVYFMQNIKSLERFSLGGKDRIKEENKSIFFVSFFYYCNMRKKNTKKTNVSPLFPFSWSVLWSVQHLNVMLERMRLIGHELRSDTMSRV